MVHVSHSTTVLNPQQYHGTMNTYPSSSLQSSRAVLWHPEEYAAIRTHS